MQRTTFPLHPAQEDVYTDQLININSPHYNIGGYIQLKGPLNKKRFHEAVSSAPLVFGVFKMRFDLNDVNAVYVDNSFDSLDLPELDFSERIDPRGEAQHWVQIQFNTPFSIKRESLLFEHCLIKISDKEHWFFCKYHHLITDGYGFIIFISYVAQKYRSLMVEDDLILSYPSYQEEAIKARQYKHSVDYISDQEYWLKKLTAKPQRFLYKKYELANGLENKGSTYVLDFNRDERVLLDTIQRITQCGLQQLTIAALLIYFGKTTNQPDFLFGIPVHKRGSRQQRQIFGMFSGILPHKISFQKSLKLIDLFKAIGLTQRTDYRHHNYQIGDLSRHLKINAAEGYLCEVIVNYELLNFELFFDEQIEAAVIQISSDQQGNPLQLTWRDFGSQQPMQLHFHFWKDYFSAEELRLLARRLIFIIQQFPEALHRDINSIDILPCQERQLLEKFTNTSVSYTTNKTIVDLLEAQVTKTPHAVALVFDKQQMSYKELNERSNQLAHYLISQGVKEQMPVPMCIERSFEMIIAILAVLKAGGAYVPIDPAYPEERIRFMIEDTRASMIICSTQTSKKLQSHEALNIINLNSGLPVLSEQPTDNPGKKIAPGHLAYVIYTSGSTGKPKGVMIEHAGVVNLINAQSKVFNISSIERILQFSNYCFDASVEQIFLALFNGACLVLFTEGLQLNTALFEVFLKEEKITHLHATPFFLENLKEANYECLRRVIAGGDVCKKTLSAFWKGRVDFYNEYGPTETTVTVIEFKDDNDVLQEINAVPIGKPVANNQAYILDNDQRLCPIGVTGELWIGGAQLARGYLNLPHLTLDKFIADPFSDKPEARIYKTGDICRWLPDGNMEYLGRKDEQVKIRGYRIELGEIETVLQQNESVSHAVVLALKDKEGTPQLVAYVVPKGVFNKESLRSYLRSKLPEYMVPPLFIELEYIPLTANGKIDRSALPIADISELLRKGFVTPGNDTEVELARIWKDLLDVERVGIHDNFFELGGHSLTAIQLVSRLNKRFHIQIDVQKIFAYPTIKELCHILPLEQLHEFNDIKRLPEQNDYELSHSQKRIWVLSHFKDGSMAYSVPTAYILEGNLSLEKLKQALDVLIERHEILRTVFIEVNGEPRQKILPSAAIRFVMEEVDLKADDKLELAIKKAIKIESSQPFDLTKGPLFRATLFRESNERYILVFNIHHIISDGWSKGILIKEILFLYKNSGPGLRNELAPLPIQYKEYAAWQAGSSVQQGNYWRNLYKNNIPVLNFPLDFQRPKLLSFSGAMVHATIDASLTMRLHKLATRNNFTLNNLLLSIYGMLVGNYSQQDEVVVGSLTSGRSHVDLENLVGVFINFLPIKLSPSGSLRLEEYLQNSHHSLVEAYSNQDYPFDLMVSDCIGQRDVSHNPFFDTMVNFHSEDDFRSGIPLAETFGESGLKIKPLKMDDEDFFHSVLDFKLDIEPTDSSLGLYLSYNSNLFLLDRMRKFLDKFVELLDKVVNDPQKYLYEYFENTIVKNEIPVINAAELMANPNLSVNICSSFIAEPLQEYLEYWSNEFALNVRLSFSPYNQVFQQLLDPGSALNKNHGLNILFIRPADWLRDKKDLLPDEQIRLLDQTYFEFLNAIDQAGKTSSATFLAGIVPLASSHFLQAGVAKHIIKLNDELEAALKNKPGFYLLNLNEIAALYVVDEMFDSKSDMLGHLPFTQEYYAALGTFISRKIRAYIGKAYKVLVVDCDNTLWKGVCGEVGAMGITIDANFSYLQKFLLEKYHQGFLLAICSKNNESDVWEVFNRHPEMILRQEHIAVHRINWNNKHENLVAIADELNLGLDSVIFLDDSDFEVEQLSLLCPQVLAITLPEDPSDFFDFLNHIWAFDQFQLTEEDAQRNARYESEKMRKKEQVKYDLLNDFLRSLNIQVSLRPINDKDLARATQLTLRTNQFNLNGVRKSNEDIARSIKDQSSLNWIIEVKDRFGDYGIVGVLLASKGHSRLSVESFMLSCRVLGRKVEDFVLAELQAYCNIHELHTIEAHFKSTEKNRPFIEFLNRNNFIENAERRTYDFSIKYVSPQLSLRGHAENPM